MATYTTNEAAAWIQDRWQPGIHAAAYNKAKILPHALDLTKPGKNIHYRKHANLATQVLALGGVGSNISPVSNVEAEVTQLPKTIFVYTAVSDQVLVRMIENPLDTLRPSVEMALAEGADIEAAKLATDFTTSAVGGPAANITEATFRDLIQKLATNAKGNFEIGVTEPSFIIHTSQINDVMGEPRFTEYQTRGGASTPLVSGWLVRAHGALWYASNNIQFVGNMYRHMLLIDDLSIGVGYNAKTRVKIQEFLMEQRIIGYWDAAFVTLWQEYSGQYQTQ